MAAGNALRDRRIRRERSVHDDRSVNERKRSGAEAMKRGKMVLETGRRLKKEAWFMALAGMLVFGSQSLASAAEAATEEAAEKMAAAEAVLPGDGTYEPDGFTWSGGSGRLSIECPSFTVDNGEVTAQIMFTSGKIIYVKVGDEQFEPVEQTEDASCFEVPVTLNEETDIIGCTTAMSVPHEVSYVIAVWYGEAAEAAGFTRETVEENDETEADTEEAGNAETSGAKAAADGAGESTDESVEIEGLTLTGQIDFQYARGVDIYTYEGGYRCIDVHRDGRQYLVVPEGASVPETAEDSMTVLQAPLEHTYVAATAVMALINAADALNHVSYSSLQADDWYVEAAAQAMQNGEIVYAGKYSAPDYEMLLSGACSLAVESTMILHSPDIQDMLEQLGIPVFVDWSSYEEHPLGRVEWIKVYGSLFDEEETAAAFFDEQASVMDELSDLESTGKTVAFFSVNSTGTVTVRTSGDYIAKMIELAGGSYVPENLTEEDGESGKSSMNITMEDFYSSCVDADYLVYNATIEDPISSLEELLGKNALFADFKAVQENHVWCTDRQLYQATDIVGQLMMDFHQMLTEDDADMTFLKKVE